VRGVLLLMTVGLVAVFTLAALLDAYETDGRRRRQERQRRAALDASSGNG